MVRILLTVSDDMNEWLFEERDRLKLSTVQDTIKHILANEIKRQIIELAKIRLYKPIIDHTCPVCGDVLNNGVLLTYKGKKYGVCFRHVDISDDVVKYDEEIIEWAEKNNLILPR